MKSRRKITIASEMEKARREDLRRNFQVYIQASKRPCEVCGSIDNLNAHHHQGYDGWNILKVIWLCVEHHFLVHKMDRNPRRYDVKLHVDDLMERARLLRTHNLVGYSHI